MEIFLLYFIIQTSVNNFKFNVFLLTAQIFYNLQNLPTIHLVFVIYLSCFFTDEDNHHQRSAGGGCQTGSQVQKVTKTCHVLLFIETYSVFQTPHELFYVQETGTLR